MSFGKATSIHWSIVIFFVWKFIPLLYWFSLSGDKPTVFAGVTFLEHTVNTEFAYTELSNFRNDRVSFLDTRTLFLMFLT